MSKELTDSDTKLFHQSTRDKLKTVVKGFRKIT